MTKTEYLLSLLMELPPRLDVIEKESQATNYTEKKITLAVYKFVENCCFECRNFE